MTVAVRGEPRPRHRTAVLLGLVLLAAALAAELSWGAGEGPPWRRLWFDALQQSMPRDREAQPAVVVEIDERSLAAIGQWPWPRSLVAALVWRLRDAGAEAIALDVLFPERDRLSPPEYVRWLGDVDEDVADAIIALGDTDLALREAIKGAGGDVGVALAVAGLIVENVQGEPPAIGPQVIVDGVDAERFLSFNQDRRPIDMYRQVARGVGAISYVHNDDRILRRVPLVQQIRERPYLLLAAEARRIADQSDLARIGPGERGLAINLGETVVPAEANGDFWLHFGRRDGARYVSAADVLAGDPSALAEIDGRIALVAATGLGSVDQILTPLREPAYGIEAHLQVIEQIAEQRFLRRPGEVFFVEVALTLALGAAAILLIPRASPFVSLSAFGVAFVALLAFSAVAFQQGFLIDAASPALAGGLIAVALTGVTLVERDRARLVAEIALERSRADSAKIEAELAAAWEIQRGLLPPSVRSLDGRFDLACHIRPARQVGGDFYDHFMIDDRRLLFMVGDVSGKGIEASVFMGLSKALWKSAALRPDLSFPQSLITANVEISRDNPNMMFVTGFVGVLDVETGAVDYSSAGHEAPFLFAPGRPPERLPEFAGPPAGLDPEVEFPVGRVQLPPGGGVCLFSDGVSEAEDPGRALYGVERLERRLAGVPAEASAKTVVDMVVEDVDRFAAGAPPSDDLTIMALIRPA